MREDVKKEVEIYGRVREGKTKAGAEQQQKRVTRMTQFMQPSLSNVFYSLSNPHPPFLYI